MQGCIASDIGSWLSSSGPQFVGKRPSCGSWQSLPFNSWPLGRVCTLLYSCEITVPTCYCLWHRSPSPPPSRGRALSPPKSAGNPRRGGRSEVTAKMQLEAEADRLLMIKQVSKQVCSVTHQAQHVPQTYPVPLPQCQCWTCSA